jgi:hypothetical protein
VVTINDQSAAWTVMNTNRKILENLFVAAGAILACAVGNHFFGRATSVFSFIAQLEEKHSPSRVHDALGKSAANHIANRQVLNGNQLVFTGQPLAQLVGEVPTLVSDLGVGALKAIDGFAAIRGAFFAPAQALMGTANLSGKLAGEPWVGNVFAGRKRGEMRKTNVDTDGRFDFNLWRRWPIIVNEFSKPLAGTMDDSQNLNLAVGLADIACFYQTVNTGNVDASSELDDLARVADAEAVPAIRPLESRESGLGIPSFATTKKRLEGFVETINGITLYLTRNVFQYLADASQLREVSCLIVFRECLASFFVELNPLFEGVVIELAPCV